MPVHQKISNNYQYPIITNIKSKIKNWKLETRLPARQVVNWKLKRGYSLIELLIVVAILMLVASLLTASYLVFERNQRLKNAALQIKNDLRLAQSYALSGAKGIGALCPSGSTLVGWYIKFIANTSYYSLAGDCLTANTEANFNQQTIYLPRNVFISSINYGPNVALGEANVLYRPLHYDVSVHTTMFVPDFVDNAGNLINLAGTSSYLTITLALQNDTPTYQVVVKSSGEVNEVKP